jgi:hypothetical protein
MGTLVALANAGHAESAITDAQVFLTGITGPNGEALGNPAALS